MQFKNIIFQEDEQVATITFNRPEKLNAMNDAMVHELDKALDTAEKDDNIKVVVFQGAGDNFSVGRDMGGEGTCEIERPTQVMSKAEGVLWQRRYEERLRRIASLPKNTVARVRGYCLDSGCWVALSCQVAIASEDAMFGEPAIRIGQITPLPLWAHLLGLKRATEMLFTGKVITGKEAEAIGLIMRSVPADRLDEEVDALTREMVAISLDGQAARIEGFQVASDILGLGGAWRHWGRLHMESLLRKPGRREFNFRQARDKNGLKAAIEKANAAFEGL